MIELRVLGSNYKGREICGVTGSNYLVIGLSYQHGIMGDIMW